MKNLVRIGIAIGVVASSVLLVSCGTNYVGEEYSKDLAVKLMKEKYDVEFTPTAVEKSYDGSYGIYGYTDKSNGVISKSIIYPKKDKMYDDYKDIMVCKNLTDRVTENISGLSEDFLVLSYEELVIADISQSEDTGSSEDYLYGSFEDFCSRNPWQPFILDIFVQGNPEECTDVPENVSNALNGIEDYTGMVSLYFVDEVDMKEIKEYIKVFEVGSSNYFNVRQKEFNSKRVEGGVYTLSESQYRYSMN